MKTRTIIAFTMILLMLISMFAGCGQKPAPVSSSTPAASTGTSAAPAATANPKPYEGKTLRFVTPNQPCIESTVQNSLNEFKEKTGITVEMEILGTDQFTNKVTVELSAQTKSLDVFFLRPLNDMKLFNQNQWLTDLTPYLDAEDLKDYYEGSIDSCTRDGKLYGIPIVAESQIVYYRKDIFEKNGIAKFPETMEELYNVAKKLTDKKNEFYGYVGRGKSNQVVTQFSTYLRSFGGDFNTPTESLINTPEAIEAYKFYGKLLNECSPPGIINMSWPEAAAIFAQGKAAMFADSDAIYANVTDKDKSTVSDVTGFAIMPAGPAGRKPYYAVAAALSISAFSEQKDAAAEFIKWATSKEMDVKMAQDVKNPGCRKSTWENPEATKDWPAELLDAMTKSREIAVAGDRPTVINVVQARDIISVPILEAIQGRDPTAAAKKANDEFQALIDKENAGK
jgi:multiple sugar transport system substrate-binding protein